jgi:hypothetical protein
MNYEVVSIRGNNEVGFMVSIPKESKASGFGDGFVLKSIGKPKDPAAKIHPKAFKDTAHGKMLPIMFVKR